ncbi:MAG TPA: alpha/beta hydrolase-fold protein [Gemmatimonadales bacterium]
MIEWETYPLPGTGAPGHSALTVLREVLSPQLRNYRDLLVALPPGYAGGEGRHPVVYMHDGQNLFDPATSYAGDWGILETLDALPGEGVAPIVVGIPNAGRRRRYEYSPFRDIIHGGGGGDRYLAFVVETVKPLVDASFRTLPERSHTAIAGSSLGGLVSLYGLYRYADVFGAAGLLSPALWFAGGAVLRFVEELEHFAIGRVHLDVGTGEGDDAVREVRRLRDLLLAAGHAEGRDLSYIEEKGAEHDEAAWGRRFRAAVPFLLGAGTALTADAGG